VEHLRPKIENQGLIAASLQVVKSLKFLLVFLLILEVFLTCINVVNAFDFPWQLAEGDYILDHGHSTASVLQSYGEISPHFENEYILYEALIAGINRYAGWSGLCLFFGLLCFSIYLPCLLAFLRSRYRFALIDICLFMLAQFLINMRLAARPELVADVCYVLTGIMLMRWPGRSWNGRQTFVFGLVFFFWANAHGSFLLGGAMLALWYGQLFLFDWRSLLFTKDFRWLRPGLAAFVGCALNPFGLYRFVQPFELHGLLWGQGTSIEMWPITSGVALLPLTWTTAAILALVMRVRERKFYWMILMLILLQYLTFSSIRYNMFIGLTLLVITWDGLMHPREPFSPPVLALSFAMARLGVYLYIVVAFISLNYSLFHTKIDMLQDYTQYVYPKSKILVTSSFKWLKEHPEHDYYILSNLAAGSASQMPSTNGIHPLIDSGTHRYDDPTNQLYYYSLHSPEIFRRILSTLKINAILVNNANEGWASILNTNPDWRLIQVEDDSQLYLRQPNDPPNTNRKIFAKWESEAQLKAVEAVEPGHPPTVSTERLMRGLDIRPDSESLKMWTTVSDSLWVGEPQFFYMEDWVNRLPDTSIEATLKDLGDQMDNTSAAIRILLLLRLKHDQQAMEIAQKWHPMILNMGYQDLEMVRVEAFIRGGDLKQARKILDGFWPKPRYSLRWARLCQQVYADDPHAMPPSARLLIERADQIPWQDEIIAKLNRNILRLSTSPEPLPQ